MNDAIIRICGLQVIEDTGELGVKGRVLRIDFVNTDSFRESGPGDMTVLVENHYDRGFRDTGLSCDLFEGHPRGLEKFHYLKYGGVGNSMISWSQ